MLRATHEFENDFQQIQLRHLENEVETFNDNEVDFAESLVQIQKYFCLYVTSYKLRIYEGDQIWNVEAFANLRNQRWIFACFFFSKYFLRQIDDN